MLLTQLRSLLAVIEEGSINRAALRLQISQPALSRQLQALEHVVGGQLFERGATGVKPTKAGQALAAGAKAILAAADKAMEEARQSVRGQTRTLRIGCLMSAAQPYMYKALLALRQNHPDVKIRLFDLSPGELIVGLRRGELDLALIGQEGAILQKDFYTRRLARLPVMAVVPEGHRLAKRSRIPLRELRKELFVGFPEDEMPGRNRWMESLCRKAGFRPRIGPEGGSLAQIFCLVVGERGVTLLPSYIRNHPFAGVKFLDLEDASAGWDLLVVWHRGRPAPALLALLDSLGEVASNS